MALLCWGGCTTVQHTLPSLYEYLVSAGGYCKVANTTNVALGLVSLRFRNKKMVYTYSFIQ